MPSTDLVPGYWEVRKPWDAVSLVIFLEFGFYTLGIFWW